MPDVHINKVSFAYSGSPKLVLRSIDLTIHEGEFVLLVGPSGCGKSTLALALAGLIPSRIAGLMRGGVYFGDRNVSAMNIHEVSQHIGMVFQNPEEQLIHLDVESEVAFGPENLALPRAEIAQRVSESLAFTGMQTWRKQEIFALSGGQKQRVAISATLAMRSKVLVLDEPTSDLDPVGTQEVLRVLRTLNKEYGMTIILVEHKIDEIVPWVDRVLLMDDGKIVVDAPPRRAFDDIQLWQQLGVSVPQMILLARALPDVFHGTTPLSVDEAYTALSGTDYARTLFLRNEAVSNGDAGLSREDRNVDSTPPLLSWESVSLSYGAKQVLKDINVEVRPEEWVAIIGPNGSGKTSMASLAMGFQRPTGGVVRYKGKAVVPGHISQQSEGMSYLFQAADSMLFGATVEKEFMFGVTHSRKRKKQATFSLDELLKTVDLQDHRNDNPFHLSFGQRKRLAIGALLTRHPDLLLLDEPTTGQDEGHARAFLQFLQQLRVRGQFTYAMITHDMRAVASYASRVVVLNNGHIVNDDVPERVFAHLDELTQCGILPPPIAQLHARLCEQKAARVALTVDQFLQLLPSLEARP
ncbi:MAG TPA: energy-coupling factor transporter ATPase [Ktedonobacteraceae bacterium]|jgi:energy-coupling factor transporter ATP-binding protein EcfA2|nr:energy-coupling factor transporter ATPase [Ktedonobacteraceae bacterium]